MNKKYRLRKRQDFNKVYRRGKSFANRELIMYVMENYQNEKIRVGISISKKVGNAVTRNRIKRIIKDIFLNKINENNLRQHIDIIIVARNPTSDMNYLQFNRSIDDLLRKSKLLNKKNKQLI